MNNLQCLLNKALHMTAIPLRSIAAGELGRYAINNYCMLKIQEYFLLK